MDFTIGTSSVRVCAFREPDDKRRYETPKYAFRNSVQLYEPFDVMLVLHRAVFN